MPRAHEFYKAAIEAHKQGFRMVSSRTATREGAQPTMRVQRLDAKEDRTKSNVAGEVYVHPTTGYAFSFRGGMRTRAHRSMSEAVNHVIDRKINPIHEKSDRQRLDEWNRSDAADSAAHQRSFGSATEQRNQSLADQKSRY